MSRDGTVHCELDSSTRDHAYSLFCPARSCLPKRKLQPRPFVFSFGLQQCLCALSAIQKHRRDGIMTVLSHFSSSPSAARGLVLSLSLLLSISRPTRRSRNALYSTSHFNHSLRGSRSPHIHQFDCCLFCWAVYSRIYQHNQYAAVAHLTYRSY